LSTLTLSRPCPTTNLQPTFLPSTHLPTTYLHFYFPTLSTSHPILPLAIGFPPGSLRMPVTEFGSPGFLRMPATPIGLETVGSVNGRVSPPTPRSL
jgi:hypothetical protein